MKLTTVLSAVNNNPSYYLFIPKQIIFWKKFKINFIAVFVGDKIPDSLIKYSDNIILWNKNLDLNTSYVAQIIRIYYPALINIPDDECVMITDMDMLPTNYTYYKAGLEKYNINDFIYYRHVDGNQIYMCYNAAHPSTWGKVFGITNHSDIERKLYEKYDKHYDGYPGSIGWYIDQEVLFATLINYKHLCVLNRPINRLEVSTYQMHLINNDKNFISKYDDVHFHRSYHNNETLIIDAESQLNTIFS
jgi:hypothetical protein